MKPFLALFFTVVLTARVFAEDTVAPDVTARFLAGLPVRDTPLEALCRNQSWVEHATEFDKAWKELDTRQLAKIRSWSAEFLADASADKGPMFYMFSGPDILYAQVFFPNASTYVLAGLEPVGPVPDVQHLPAGALASGLANMRKSLNSVLSFSFFITKDMKADLHQNALAGTLPILYVFLERAGCKIDSVDLVWLDKTGAVGPAGKSTTPGVKIVFFGLSGAQQTLYYFETNLANEGIKSQPGFIKFCEGLGKGRSLVKAASYLMHLGDFTAVRDFLLANSSTIVEDDSGVPIKNFDTAKWAVRYFGSYPGPIDIFKKFSQPDLAAVYKNSRPPALPFGFGYRWHPSQSSLILAMARSTNNDNAPTAKPAPHPHNETPHAAHHSRQLPRHVRRARGAHRRRPRQIRRRAAGERSRPGRAGKESWWISYASELNKKWARMDERQLAHVRSWAGGNSEVSHVSGTVYYMFSGPDFLYARTFFPRASTYILCGTEPVGSVPDITRMAPANIESYLSNVRHSLDTILTTHYFITKDMRVDLTRGSIGGTLPLLFVFLEKSGCFINSVNFSGPSVQIDLHSPSGKSQTLYYFKTDLSNGGGNGSFLSFCKRQGPGASLLKSASYLMHEEGFSTIRNFLLANSTVIIQDDSGIPLRDFDQRRWNIKFYGAFQSPNGMFGKYQQADLANASQKSKSGELGFSFGYAWQKEKGFLMEATPR